MLHPEVQHEFRTRAVSVQLADERLSLIARDTCQWKRVADSRVALLELGERVRAWGSPTADVRVVPLNVIRARRRAIGHHEEADPLRHRRRPLAGNVPSARGPGQPGDRAYPEMSLEGHRGPG